MRLNASQLDALAAIVKHESFEAAARHLNVTASAISQRIAALEERVGQILVVRGQPCRATGAGERLCRHAETVALLEQQAFETIGVVATDNVWPTVKIAINADSLATWFIDALSRLKGLYVDVVLDNEDHSADWLQRGRVIAAVSAQNEVISGCDCMALGALRYRATASPEFIARWFADGGVTPDAIARAPCLSFNTQDRLQARWVKTHIGDIEPPVGHRLPSANAFVDAAIAGIGWGMNPEMLISHKLDSGELVELLPATPFDIPLMWHHARLLATALSPLADAVAASGQQQLVQDV